MWRAARLAIGQHHIGRDIVVTVSLYPTAPTPAPIGALGVPNTARSFPFNLDDVLTQTAKQHRTAWMPNRKNALALELIVVGDLAELLGRS